MSVNVGGHVKKHGVELNLPLEVLVYPITNK